MKIINIYARFDTVGGAQNIVYSLYRYFEKNNNESYLCSLTKYRDLLSVYKCERSKYLDLYQIFFVDNSVVFSHHRKITFLLVLLSKVLSKKINLIHVAHNEFKDFRWLALFPKKNIAVSNAVKNNLMSVYGVNSYNVDVIYNGVVDLGVKAFKRYLVSSVEDIRILYPARINDVKGQLDLVENVSGLLSPKVKIFFAGKGEDSEKLEIICKNNKNFSFLGYCDIGKIIDKYDFMMLFSKKEGLPVSLIEGCMYGMPIICNSVGGNEEIVVHGYNGYVVNSYTELIKLLNGLCDKRDHQNYYSMCKASRNMYEELFSYDSFVGSYSSYI